MRDRLQRLAPVQRFAERQEEAAADALARANAAVQDAARTLDELRSYRSSYHRQSRDTDGWSGARLHDYQQFLSRLDQAIRAQAEVVDDLDKRRQVILTLWQDKRRRCQSMSQLAERLLAEARERKAAAQQKIDDAMALSRSQRPPSF